MIATTVKYENWKIDCEKKRDNERHRAKCGKRIRKLKSNFTTMKFGIKTFSTKNGGREKSMGRKDGRGLDMFEKQNYQV